MEDIGYEIKLPNNYEESIILLTNALKEEGFGVLTEIDVKDTFKKSLMLNLESIK